MQAATRKDIDGITYVSQPLPAREALAIGVQLLQVVGPTLATFASEDEREVDARLTAKAGEAAQRLAEMLDDQKVIALVLRILKATERIDPETNQKQQISDGRVFDTVYMANLGEALKAIGFALEVNRFFGQGGIGGVLDRLGSLRTRLASAT
jgi:hypothetical protein